MKWQEKHEDLTFREAIKQVKDGHISENEPIVTQWARSPESKGVATLVYNVIDRDRGGLLITPPSSALPLLP